MAEIKQSENPSIYDLGAINYLLTCPLLEPVKKSKDMVEQIHM